MSITAADGAERTFTFDAELGSGYYVRIPSAFLRLPKSLYSAEAKTAYGVLLSYAGDGAKAWPGQAILAEQVGCSPNTLRAALAQLEAGGLLTTKRRGQGLPNTYHLHRFDPDLRRICDADTPPSDSRNANPDVPETQNLRFKKRKNDSSRTSKSASPEPQNLSTSNESVVINNSLPSEERVATPPRTPGVDGFDIFAEIFQSTHGRQPVSSNLRQSRSQAAQLLSSVGEPAYRAALAYFFGPGDPYFAQQGHPWMLFVRQFDQIIAKSRHNAPATTTEPDHERPNPAQPADIAGSPREGHPHNRRGAAGLAGTAPGSPRGVATDARAASPARSSWPSAAEIHAQRAAGIGGGSGGPATGSTPDA